MSKRGGSGGSGSSNYRPGDEWRPSVGDNNAAVSGFFATAAAWNQSPTIIPGQQVDNAAIAAPAQPSEEQKLEKTVSSSPVDRDPILKGPS